MASAPTASDLAVVIPVRGRHDVLARVLDALERQTVHGFDTVVVLDGLDEPDVDRPGVRVLRRPQAGPGAARNAGVDATDRPLVLFLGADMIPAPDLVARHLGRHGREPGDRLAVLGRVRWHPDVAGNRLNRWLDWSATQFDYEALDRESAAGMPAAGFGRFYSCNVSLHRSLVAEVGGFDEGFAFYYEDLDLGWRLDRAGMVLRYEPDALVEHLHAYDWPAVVARFEGIAVGERRMAERHGWFEPFFRARVLAAAAAPPAWSGWRLLAGRVAWPVARRAADRWYHQRLAGPFLDGWEGGRDLEELRAHLGDRYDEARLRDHVAEVEREEAAAPDEATFYRTSESYLYDLTVFALSGTKAPYLDLVRRLAPPGGRLLDFGCGIGADGLRLLEQGYRVDFADFDNPSARFLRWRLERRGLDARVHDLDRGLDGRYDLAYCFDVLEHVDDPLAVLRQLESLADVVVVNLLEPDPSDTHVHKPLDIEGLLDHAASLGLRHHARHHGRSHLIAYTSTPRRGLARLRSAAWRRLGGRSRATRLLDRAEGVLLGAQGRRRAAP